MLTLELNEHFDTNALLDQNWKLMCKRAGIRIYDCSTPVSTQSKQEYIDGDDYNRHMRLLAKEAGGFTAWCKSVMHPLLTENPNNHVVYKVERGSFPRIFPSEVQGIYNIAKVLRNRDLDVSTQAQSEEAEHLPNTTGANNTTPQMKQAELLAAITNVRNQDSRTSADGFNYNPKVFEPMMRLCEFDRNTANQMGADLHSYLSSRRNPIYFFSATITERNKGYANKLIQALTDVFAIKPAQTLDHRLKMATDSMQLYTVPEVQLLFKTQAILSELNHGAFLNCGAIGQAPRKLAKTIKPYLEGMLVTWWDPIKQQIDRLNDFNALANLKDMARESIGGSNKIVPIAVPPQTLEEITLNFLGHRPSGR